MNIVDNKLSFRGGTPNNNIPRELILHHIEANGWSVERLHSLHKDSNGWSGIGYHYYVRKDGSIYRGRPDYMMGAHCQGANKNSIGIAFEGRYNAEDKTMPAAQLSAGKSLISYLLSQYGNLPIYGHRERGSSDCPGKYFPLEQFRSVKASSSVMGETQKVSTYTVVTNSSNKKALIKRLQDQINKQGFGSIAVDGIAGTNTIATAPMCRRGARGEITRVLQDMLINMGYVNFLKPWGADAVFGGGTEEAIKSFQKRYGLSSDGIVGTNTWKMIFNKLN